MSAPVDHLGAATTYLAASTTTTGEVGERYTACARIAFEKARAQLADIERLLLAREAELVRTPRGTP